ncbi:hypothetical protein BCV09_18045 [Vibrio cyclitrophicus]|uniref:hypothetical protein n=1 Tax=Vibrio cyclitrophicus TaxID=47951 RepID=UPI0002D5EE72|nr:hypothetical protein [Vibrio cyclitrophicus]OEF42381.1 hypothetical protein OAE_16080 [Vibrio cyclitrophicus 1F289]PMF14248.1 hypothetical protein BCV20_10955 [Vibrio cyclitrophicus]PMF59517.1 hypothetical protein BCV09_21450 [Vibrio cyclitrophicus]
MQIIFFIVGLLLYFFGFVVFSGSRSSIHETVGLLIFLNGTLFVIAAGIIDAINKNGKVEKTD